MTITLNGTTGITTPAVTNNGAYTGDGISFADGTPSNTLVTDTSGNVCVGSTAAGNAGAINVSVGLAGTTAGGIQLWSNTTASHSIQWGDGTSSTDPYRGYIEYAHNGDSMRFATASTERMRIDSSGNVYVGSSTGEGKLYALQTADTNATVSEATNASLTNTVHLVYASRNTTNSSFKAIGYYNKGASAYKFVVQDSGNVQNTNNSYGAISDIKLKENIVDATPKLEQLCQVKVRNYNLIGDTTKQLGVVAQELEQIFPSMIDESVDRDEKGNDLGTTTKAVKYSVFVPMLIKAIQEQQAIITDLKARIETLENK